MRIIRAFLMGWQEWGLDLTTHYDNERLLNAYDWGRAISARFHGRKD